MLALPGGVAPPLVEWGGALRWVQAAPGHAQALHDAARQAGGSASLFKAHSADGESAAAFFDPLPAGLQAIHERLRQSFDPAGIFNPGRMAWQR